MRLDPDTVAPVRADRASPTGLARYRRPNRGSAGLGYLQALAPITWHSPLILLLSL